MAGGSQTAANTKPTLSASDFVHLHNHTHYSVLDGLTKVPKLVDHVKGLGMEAVAITDHGTMSGAIELYQAAEAAKIKPIIGMEAYIAARKHTDKEAGKDKQIFHLTLLAMNNQGYENLMRLSTIAHLEGFYYKPRIDRELLERHNAGLIVLSGCIGGEVGDALRNSQYASAVETARWYHRVFSDRYYLELQDHGYQWDEQQKVNNQLLKLSRELNIPAVVTSDAHYIEHKDQEAHEILLCVQTGAYYADTERMSLKDTDLFVESPMAIIERWQEQPELITNTRAIADRCDVTIELGNILIPRFDVPTQETERAYLHRLTWQGLAWRYGNIAEDKAANLTINEAKQTLTPDIIDRADFELDTIGKMGFDGYFLIVADFVTWGKGQDIVFGPGRGSAAGSIVSYAIKITDLDPLEYDLLFERFLNPDRISMPDIDIDIQDNRRDEVIQYTVEKYGEDRVANIVTFGKMAARNAIRDVARVLEVPYADADRLAKLVPPPVQGRHIPLESSITTESDLRNEYESSAQSKRVIDLAVQLEGTIRSHGVHAAGVVIAPDDIVKFTPLEMAQKGVVATQYSMGPIEDIGLLKMDFLGLSNLTIIKNALRIIKKVHQNTIDISAIPLDDESTYELLGQGDTTGVFQFESAGMKRYLKQLKPTVFEDIIAMGALYRPGPLTAGLTDKFIARKNGDEPVEYEHPKMEPALSSTYGVLVYQEQVMRIARDMCGFSGGQADTLRKAIGKKKADLMAKMKVEFVDGMIEHSGVERSFAEKFWKDLEGFADYAFNKSHSACYGLIAYQTAYLKAHYPDAFMAALMTSGYDDTERLALMISECRSMELEVLQPDVNESFAEFAVVPGKQQIRFGMEAIKNVGHNAVEEIIRARDADGHFSSIEDFVNRVNVRIVNRKNLESLIKAGAFDSINSRANLLQNLDSIIGFGQKIQKEKESGQADLFGGAIETNIASHLELTEAPHPIPEKERLQWERELLGIYLSSHPLDRYRTYLREQALPLNNLTLKHEGVSVRIGGIISSVREITTKNGKHMAFVGLEDLTDELEMIIFPGVYDDSADFLKVDNVIVADGKMSTKDRDGREGVERKVLVDSVTLISEETIENYQPTGRDFSIPGFPGTTKRKLPSKPPKHRPHQREKSTLTRVQAQRLFVHVKDPDDHDQLLKLKQTLNKHPGDTEAILVLGEREKSALRLPFRVDVSNGLTHKLGQLLSEECVALR
jgi:DNA polymerase-3 subunit alpha